MKQKMFVFRKRSVINEFINDLGQMECERVTKLENGESGFGMTKLELFEGGWWCLSKRKII